MICWLLGLSVAYAPQLLLSVAATPFEPKQSFIVYESLLDSPPDAQLLKSTATRI